MQRLLDLAGISLDTVVTHDVTGEQADRYRILRSTEDLHEVLTLTRDPSLEEGAELADALAINVVLVDDIVLADAAGTIGQAGLLPGPAGLHGTEFSGVVASAATFRDNPAYLALILAHETGHFLGLRHTSELFTEEVTFGRTDPLEDTPECPDVAAILEACPDYDNLMFPLAPLTRDADRLELTADQAWVLRRNPLIR
jgi:hypothetical protein